jgi:serine/threonine-protein kinase
VAAVTSPEVRESAPPERFRWLRELGSTALPTWAALDLAGSSQAPGPGAVGLAGGRSAADGLAGGRSAADGATYRGRLVVVQRALRGRFEDAELADWVRDARRVAILSQPNVARVRDAVIRKDDVLVVGDFIDGVRWSELAARGTPLAVALRVFVDLLSGLSALHDLRDAAQKPLGLIHGALSPDAVIVGSDGVARLVDCVRPAGLGRARGGEGWAYRAPEVLLGDATADRRADVYSAGVMLWEALSGARLFDGEQPSTIVTTLLSGRVPRATIPEDAPWAAALQGTIARALSPEPEKRFASASEMATEIRRVVGPRLAPTTRAAVWVDDMFGEPIRRRRRELEGPPPGASRAPAVDVVDAAIDVEELEVKPAAPAPAPPLKPAPAPAPPPALAPSFLPPTAPAFTPAPAPPSLAPAPPSLPPTVSLAAASRPTAPAFAPTPIPPAPSFLPPAQALTPAPLVPPSYEDDTAPAAAGPHRRGAVLVVAGVLLLGLAAWGTVRSVRSGSVSGSIAAVAAPPAAEPAPVPAAALEGTPQPPEAPPATAAGAQSQPIAPDEAPAFAPQAARPVPAARTRTAPKHAYEPQGI